MEVDFDVYDIRLPAKGLRHGVNSHVEYLGNRSIMAAIGARRPYTICSAIPGVYWDFHKTGDSKSFPLYVPRIISNIVSRTFLPELSPTVVNAGINTVLVRMFIISPSSLNFSWEINFEVHVNMITLFIHSVGRDVDWICNWVGNQRVAEAVTIPGQEAFKGWKMGNYSVGGVVSGTFKTEGNLTFLRVFQAGHGVSSSKPKLALQVFEQTMKGESLRGT